MNIDFNIINYNSFSTKYSLKTSGITFGQRGKPVSLEYILKYRANLLPKRVLDEVCKITKTGNPERKSLLDIHKSIYKPLLKCKSLEEVCSMFTEFAEINDVEISYRKNTIDEVKKVLDVKKDFALNVIKEYWANLKTKDEIAQMFGMKGRGTLDWALDRIGFVTYSPNYRTIIKSSDETGNKTIAEKTRNWLANHKEYMFEHNKKAAQDCKTDEYRKTQSARMIAYDRKNPERRIKIKDFSARMWEKCPELKKAFSDFTEQYLLSSENKLWLKSILAKRAKKKKLTEEEKRILKAYYKEFWKKYPEHRYDLKNAAEEVRRENCLKLNV